MLQPPTDSLHKFCAVGGIAFAFWGVGNTLHEFEKYETARVELVGKVNEMRQHYIAFAEGVNAMSALAQDIDRAPSKNYERALQDEFSRIQDQIEPHKSFMDSSNVNSDPLFQKTEVADKLWRFHLVIGIFCGVVGAGVSGWGFSRWAKEGKQKATAN